MARTYTHTQRSQRAELAADALLAGSLLLAAMAATFAAVCLTGAVVRRVRAGQALNARTDTAADDGARYDDGAAGGSHHGRRAI